MWGGVGEVGGGMSNHVSFCFGCLVFIDLFFPACQCSDPADVDVN